MNNDKIPRDFVCLSVARYIAVLCAVIEFSCNTKWCNTIIVLHRHFFFVCLCRSRFARVHWSSLTPPAATTTTTATVAHCVILLNNYRQAQFNLQRNCQQINMQESSQSESCSTQYEQKQFSYSIVYLPLSLSLLLDLHLFVLFVAICKRCSCHIASIVQPRITLCVLFDSLLWASQ